MTRQPARPRKLGEVLRDVRVGVRRVSLKAIAEPAGISPAYLQKMEMGEVKDPSPHVLYRISQALGISYSDLMTLAGYVVPSRDSGSHESEAGRSDVRILAQALNSEELTEGELRDLAAYLEFIRSRKGE